MLQEGPRSAPESRTKGRILIVIAYDLLCNTEDGMKLYFVYFIFGVSHLWLRLVRVGGDSNATPLRGAFLFVFIIIHPDLGQDPFHNGAHLRGLLIQ